MQGQVVQQPEINPTSHPDLSSLSVLVVDDEAIIRDTLSSYLLHLGIKEVKTEPNGKLALKAISEGHFDYVFMDIMMPEMDGMDVLKHLNVNGKPTSIILMTGYPSMQRVIEAMHYGASDFLVKPFRLQDVKLSIERIHKLHSLMKKNWLLNKELEQKKQVEKLNDELQKKIKEKTLLYEIIDSLSKINLSEDLYSFIVKKAAVACNAQKACFLICDVSKNSFLSFTQHGIDHLSPGMEIQVRETFQDVYVLDGQFIEQYLTKEPVKPIVIDRVTRTPNLISVPLQIRGELFGLLLVAQKKGDKSYFDHDDEFILSFLVEKAALNVENMALYHNLKENLFATLSSLVSAIEARDTYTQQHSERVTRLALQIAYEMNCKPEDLRRIQSTGPLHDIGKIGIDDHILKKPGKLTQKEFEAIKAHPLIGVNIVSHLGLDKEELAIVRNHHERWDGGGYPDGLRADEIPRLARILAVADAFDAMNSERAYRLRLPFSNCIEELKRNSGTQFDPTVVEAAISVLV